MENSLCFVFGWWWCFKTAYAQPRKRMTFLGKKERMENGHQTNRLCHQVDRTKLMSTEETLRVPKVGKAGIGPGRKGAPSLIPSALQVLQ